MKHLINPMKNTVIFLGLLWGFANTSKANELFLDLNPDEFHARFDATHSSNSVIYSSALLITDDNGSMISFGGWAHGKLSNNKHVHGGLGAKAYAIDAKRGDSDEYFAFAIGGNLRFGLRQVKNLSFDTEVFFAPAILVSGDFENLVDFTFRANYQLFENGSVYTSFRNIQADYNENDEHELVDGLNIGIRIDI